MIIVIKLITFLIGSFLLFNIVKAFFLKDNYNTIIYPTVVFYFFCYLPLFYDLVIGRPDYDLKFSGFIVSFNNTVVEIIYCFVLIYIMLLFRSFQKRHFYRKKLEFNSTSSNWFFILGILGMTLYVLPLLFNPHIFSVILNYDIWYYADETFSQIKSFSFFFIFISLFLLIIEENRKIFWLKLIILIPYIYLGFLMNGKRNIVFIFFVGLIYIILTNRIIRNKMIYIFIIPIILFSLLSYSSWYQDDFNRGGGDSFQEEYTDFRVNFGRDNTMKMVIYSELFDNNKILDYKGQSMLFYPTAFIPRDLWEDKPLPFSQYLTSYLLGYQDGRLLGWSMTTNVIDEFLANCGIFIGALLSPFFYIFLCKLGMRYSKGILGNLVLVLSIFLSIILMAVQMSAFVTALYLLILCIVIYKFSSRFTLKIKR